MSAARQKVTSLRCALSSCDGYRWTRPANAQHGVGVGRIALTEVPDMSVRNDRDLDPRKTKLVELRYFGGLSVEETAAVLEVSEGTVTRESRLARAWLLTEIDKA
jgi:hypothetical protein